MKKLHLSESLALPLDAVTETAAILAVKRAGKSNAGVVMAEEMFDAGVPWCAVDPKGDWWGVRASGDGKSKGLPVVVFGGEHADVPLEPTSGRLIARLIAEKRLTCVLDVSTMTKADQRRFLTDFAEELYKLNRDPMHLFCEEADEYIPQQVRGEAARMVGAFETLVKRGGFRGIGVTLITQRSASLNKDVLTQAGTLFAMRTPSPQDRKAVSAWIEQHSASKEIVDELPKLQAGEAWVFSTLREPALQKIRFRRRRTFDSGATPKVGEKVRPPATLADVDLAAITAEMAETIERAKAEDPKALRAEVARLRADLAKAEKAHRDVKPAKVVEKKVEVRVAEPKTLARAEKAMERADALSRKLDAGAKVVAAELEAVCREMRKAFPGIAAAHPVPRYASVRAVTPAPRPAAAPRAVTVGAGELGAMVKGELAILTAAAQHDGGVTREQLTVLTGYKRSSRDTYVQRLRQRGFVAEIGDRLTATDAGAAALGDDFQPLPAGAALLDHWRKKLPAGELACLEVAVKVYPDAVLRDSISEATGYQRSSRDTYLQRLRSRRLITEPSRGQVRAADELFDGEVRAHV